MNILSSAHSFFSTKKLYGARLRASEYNLVLLRPTNLYSFWEIYENNHKIFAIFTINLLNFFLSTLAKHTLFSPNYPSLQTKRSLVQQAQVLVRQAAVAPSFVRQVAFFYLSICLFSPVLSSLFVSSYSYVISSSTSDRISSDNPNNKTKSAF